MIFHLSGQTQLKVLCHLPGLGTTPNVFFPQQILTLSNLPKVNFSKVYLKLLLVFHDVNFSLIHAQKPNAHPIYTFSHKMHTHGFFPPHILHLRSINFLPSFQRDLKVRLFGAMVGDGGTLKIMTKTETLRCATRLDRGPQGSSLAKIFYRHEVVLSSQKSRFGRHSRNS